MDGRSEKIINNDNIGSIFIFECRKKKLLYDCQAMQSISKKSEPTKFELGERFVPLFLPEELFLLLPLKATHLSDEIAQRTLYFLIDL